MFPPVLIASAMNWSSPGDIPFSSAWTACLTSSVVGLASDIGACHAPTTVVNMILLGYYMVMTFSGAPDRSNLRKCQQIEKCCKSTQNKTKVEKNIFEETIT